MSQSLTTHEKSIASIFRLDGRTAIVTGGTRGLGNSIASAFLDAGANVVITGRQEQLVRTAAEQLGGKVLGVAAHMGDADQIKSLVEVSTQTFGGVDIIVNNAAISLGLSVGELTNTGLDKSLAVNFIGPVTLIQCALEHLRRSPAPSIVNVLSAGIIRPSPGLAGYLATKAALEMMTRSMALELAPDGIRVNGIAPGAFETDMVMNMDTTRQQSAIDRCPMGRLGRLNEIVGPVLFLAADSGSFVTGTTILVDGGRSL